LITFITFLLQLEIFWLSASITPLILAGFFAIIGHAHISLLVFFLSFISLRRHTLFWLTLLSAISPLRHAIISFILIRFFFFRWLFSIFHDFHFHAAFIALFFSIASRVGF
jgi:hypothetical protein